MVTVQALLLPSYSSMVPPMLCSSVHTTVYKFNRSVTVVTATVFTSLMLYNNLLHDIMSHDRTWFCQISKYRTSGFTWQAEFDTCNAKSFQLLSRVCNGITGSSVLLRISCVKLVAYKKKRKKKKKSAFQITRLCFHQSCNYSNSCSTQDTLMLLFYLDCKLHVRYPYIICLTRYVTAVIVRGHHDCITPLQNSVAATKQQPQACPDNRAGL